MCSLNQGDSCGSEIRRDSYSHLKRIELARLRDNEKTPPWRGFKRWLDAPYYCRAPVIAAEIGGTAVGSLYVPVTLPVRKPRTPVYEPVLPGLVKVNAPVARFVKVITQALVVTTAGETRLSVSTQLLGPLLFRRNWVVSCGEPAAVNAQLPA